MFLRQSDIVIIDPLLIRFINSTDSLIEGSDKGFNC